MLANCSGVQGRNLNRKAKGWAQTQLRRATIPVLKNSNLHHIGEFWGYTAQESTEMMLDEVSSFYVIIHLLIWLKMQIVVYPPVYL